MCIDLLPRAHARYLKLPLLGDHLDGLGQRRLRRGSRPCGFADGSARCLRSRLCWRPTAFATSSKCRRSVSLSLAPRPARTNVDLSALVGSMAAYLDDSNLLHVVDPDPGAHLVRPYPGGSSTMAPGPYAEAYRRVQYSSPRRRPCRSVHRRDVHPPLGIPRHAEKASAPLADALFPARYG